MEYFLIYLTIGLLMMLAFADKEDSINTISWLLLFPFMILIKIIDRVFDY